MIKRAIIFCARLYVKVKYGIKNDYAATCLAVDFYHDYKARKKSAFEIFSIHQKGFTVANWMFLKLDEKNYKRYLTDAEYYGMHPLNGKHSYIIDDKLNLKNYCSGTELDKYMPRYYYRINADGVIEKLMDCPFDSEKPSAEDIARLLKDSGTLAIKQTSGSLGIGFYKGVYENGSYYLNDEVLTEREFCARISQLKSYLITEYLYPHKELAEYCPYTCNCIRYTIGRIDGKMKLLHATIRFGTKQSGKVENYNAGGVMCFLNDAGEFFEGNIINKTDGSNNTILVHPDNGKSLVGKVPLWNAVIKAGEDLDKYMPQMNYMGIDFAITDKEEVKIIEINSLNSLNGLQLNGSILETEAGEFFRQYL